MTITLPGIYDMPSDDYHVDPTPTASLSAGMINDILIAPAKCYENSRRLNPDWEEPEDTGKFTIGSVSHVLHLEEHEMKRKVVVCEYDDWRKNEAKAKRDDAQKNGQVAILSKNMEKVYEARDAFHSHPFAREAFTHGDREQSMFWKHPIYGFWCRSRPDFVASSRSHLCDLKVTANAEPSNFGRHAYNLGYYRRAAWYLEGCEAITGIRPAHYWFVNQEPKAPYLISVCELDHIALEAGKDENDLAAGIFANCMETGDWYGYRDRDHPDKDRAFRESMPPYAYMQIDRRLGRDGRAWPAPPRPVETEPEYEGIE